MRTALGASVLKHFVPAQGITSPKGWTQEDVDEALRDIASTIGLRTDQMQAGIRDTLLVMWDEYSGRRPSFSRAPTALLRLLRQEIEYAVFYLEQLTRESVDFLSPYWYSERGPWARLIDALPRETELARRKFPSIAPGYLKQASIALPQMPAIDEKFLRAFVTKHWQRNRPFRRFALAFHRLHDQLHATDLMASDGVIHGDEKIEQFLLTVLHTERVLSQVYRKRARATKRPNVRELAKDTLNHVLHKWKIGQSSIRVRAPETADDLLKKRATLHRLDPAKGLELVYPEDIASGNNAADHITAALVNFVIARNYAAHHDDLDYEFIFPGERVGKPHLGGTVLTSVLISVLAALATA